MNWKRLTIQLLTAVSASLPLMSVRGQNCECQPRRSPILFQTIRPAISGSSIDPAVEKQAFLNRKDGSWFQPLSPEHGVFREGSAMRQGSPPRQDLTSQPADPGFSSAPPTSNPASGTTGITGDSSSGDESSRPTVSSGGTSSGTSSTIPPTNNVDTSSSDDSSSLLTSIEPPREVFPDPPVETPDTPDPSSGSTESSPDGITEDAPVVPEPGSFLLMTLGSSIGTFIWYRRRSVIR